MLRETRREVLEKYKESVELNTDFSYLESYWRKGGTYELPVEIVNDLTGRIEELVAFVKVQLKYAFMFCSFCYFE